MPTSAILARYPDLAGRTVFVSGGGSGIGAAFVRAFAGQGCKRCVHRHRRCAVARACGTSSARAVRYWRCDVRDIARAQGRDRRSGRGLRSDPRARQQCRARRPAHVRRRDARVLGRQPGRQSAAPILRRAGGRAADGSARAAARSSTSARCRGCADGPSLPAYTTAKAAINGLTRTLARELGARNIRVNCIVPGAIATERQRALWFSPETGAAVPRSAMPQVPAVGGRRRAHRAVPRVRRGARHHRAESRSSTPVSRRRAPVA